MGPNMIATAINQSARSVTILCNIRDKFDCERNIPVPTTSHSTKSDQVKVASVLLKNKTLSIITGRKLSHFTNFSVNPLTNLKFI